MMDRIDKAIGIGFIAYVLGDTSIQFIRSSRENSDRNENFFTRILLATIWLGGYCTAKEIFNK